MQLYCIFMPVAPLCFWDRRYASLLFGLTPLPLTWAELNLAAAFWAQLKKKIFFWARGMLGSLHKSKDSTSSIGRKNVLSSEAFPELAGSKIQGRYRRCTESENTAAKSHMLIRMPEGWQNLGSNFSSTHLHSTFLGNQQGDVGSDY